MTYLLQQHVSFLSSATSQHVGVFADVLTSCELLRVFLLLLLQVSQFVSHAVSETVSLSCEVSLVSHAVSATVSLSCEVSLVSHAVSIGVGAQSTLGGGKTFLSEKYVCLINKMPESYMIFARKCPNFT